MLSSGVEPVKDCFNEYSKEPPVIDGWDYKGGS